MLISPKAAFSALVVAAGESPDPFLSLGVLRGLDTPGDKSNGFWAMGGDAKGFEVDEKGSGEFSFFSVSIYECRSTAAVPATTENTKYDYVECSSQLHCTEK